MEVLNIVIKTSGKKKEFFFQFQNWKTQKCMPFANYYKGKIQYAPFMGYTWRYNKRKMVMGKLRRYENGKVSTT
jgi:hypothetical protein